MSLIPRPGERIENETLDREVVDHIDSRGALSLSDGDQSERIGVIKEIVRGLSVQPAYLLIFGVVSLFTGLGTATGVMGLFTSDKPLIGFGGFMLFTSLAAAVLTVKLVQRAGSFSDDAAMNQPLRAGLCREIEYVRGLVLEPLLKKDLHFTLYIQGLEEIAQGKRVALVSLSCQYEIVSTSNEVKEFPIVAQVDASTLRPALPRARLTVVDRSSGRERLSKEFGFSETKDVRGLHGLFQDTIEVEPNSYYLVDWKTQQYAVDLPYAEFWASANPVAGMSFDVVIAAELPLRAHADVYRRIGSSGKFAEKDLMGTHSIRAEGPFLPFQGIFVRVVESWNPTP